MIAHALDGASGARMSSARHCTCGKHTSCTRACKLKIGSCTASVRLWYVSMRGNVSWESSEGMRAEVDSASSEGDLRKTRENWMTVGGCRRNEACFMLRDVRFEIDRNYR